MHKLLQSGYYSKNTSMISCLKNVFIYFTKFIG